MEIMCLIGPISFSWRDLKLSVNNFDCCVCLSKILQPSLCQFFLAISDCFLLSLLIWQRWNSVQREKLELGEKQMEQYCCKSNFACGELFKCYTSTV